MTVVTEGDAMDRMNISARAYDRILWGPPHHRRPWSFKQLINLNFLIVIHTRSAASSLPTTS